MRIAHFSDMHCGKSWMFNRESLASGFNKIRGLEPDLAIITGDLTDWGLRFEFEEAKGHLDGLGIPYHVVPGNHDARHSGFTIFEELFCKDRQRNFSITIGNIRLIGIDSSEPDLDEGHVGRDQLAWLENELSSTDLVPIVFLHHHIIPIPRIGRERNVLLDAGDTLELLDRKKVPLVLTGHKHFPWVWDLNDTVISNAGTISCERRCCPMSFNMVDIENGEVTITRHHTMGDSSEVMRSFQVNRGV